MTARQALGTNSMPGIALLAALASLAGTPPARAQAAAHSSSAPRGFVLTPQVVVFPILAWDAPVGLGSQESKLLVAVGLKLNYAPRPYSRTITIAPYAAVRAAIRMTILFGGSPVVTGHTYEAGLELRKLLARHILGSVTGGLGAWASTTTDEQSPPSFRYGVLGAGLQLLATPRTAITYGIEYSTTVAGALVHDDLRHLVGVSWYLGR